MNDPVIDAALATGSSVEVIECDPELADTTQFCNAYGFGLEQSANAIIVVGKSEPRRYACCVVLATTRLNVNTTVRRTLGTRKASFASANETRTLTGMEIGGVTPFGVPDDLPLLIDSLVLAIPRVIVGGGSRDRKLLVESSALARLANAEIIDGLASCADITGATGSESKR